MFQLVEISIADISMEVNRLFVQVIGADNAQCLNEAL